MEEQTLHREIKARLRAALGDRLRGVVLYGSFARGESSGESDLDLFVIVDRVAGLGDDLEAIIRALYPMQLAMERPIHALPVAEETFEAGEFGIYRQAKAEGIVL